LTITEAVKRINERIFEACLRTGRNPAEVRLMAVSKFHTRSEIEEAWQAGIRLFGESRVQEAVAKLSDFRTEHPGAELHLIGTLQRNKVKTAAAFFDTIQSVDRDALIADLAAAVGRPQPLQVLLELHTGEDSKAGFPDTDSLCRAAEKLLSYPALTPVGLMTMAPFVEDAGRIRMSFRALRVAAERLAARFPGTGWSCLSMGMSNDFEIAIEEGSTLVRIGTALFGERYT
jgi:pyridoxal phosphate enzyme (YggS family)